MYGDLGPPQHSLFPSMSFMWTIIMFFFSLWFSCWLPMALWRTENEYYLKCLPSVGQKYLCFSSANNLLHGLPHFMEQEVNFLQSTYNLTLLKTAAGMRRQDWVMIKNRWMSYQQSLSQMPVSCLSRTRVSNIWTMGWICPLQVWNPACKPLFFSPPSPGCSCISAVNSLSHTFLLDS